MTQQQRRVAYTVSIVVSVIGACIVYLNEPGPRTISRFLLFTVSGLLFGFGLAKVLVPSPELESDRPDNSGPDNTR